MNHKVIIGLCGGIGSGKSTVAKMFGDLRCAVINADAISHEMIEMGEIKEKLAQWWGPGVIKAGKVDRKAVAEIVFKDSGELEKLTELLHPLIAERERALIEEYQQVDGIKAIILDVPLLIESGQDKWCDYVVFVDTDEPKRYERVRQTRGWDDQRIKNAENLQFPLDKKAKISDYRVANNSGIPGVATQIATILSQILGSEKDKKTPPRR